MLLGSGIRSVNDYIDRDLRIICRRKSHKGYGIVSLTLTGTLCRTGLTTDTIARRSRTGTGSFIYNTDTVIDHQIRYMLTHHLAQHLGFDIFYHRPIVIQDLLDHMWLIVITAVD